MEGEFQSRTLWVRIFTENIQSISELPLTNILVPKNLVDSVEYIRTHSERSDIVQDSQNDPLFVVSALSERQQFLVFPRYNPASGYRPIFGVRKQEVEGLKRLTKMEDIAVYARKQGLRWYLLNPEDTLSWPLALLERPVYSSGGYRVYKLY